MSEANATQVGGTHYQSAYQHWDLVAEYLGSGYFKGVISKYVTRWRKKNGKEDLQKARHYLVKLIELNEAGVFDIPFTPISLPDQVYVQANDLGAYESNILNALFMDTTDVGLKSTLILLDELINMA